MSPEEFQTKTGVKDAALEKLCVYENLLKKWQKSLNLISNTTINDIWSRHFLDSYQIEHHIPQGSTILDFGSGAGFPSLILSICRPDLTITAIESDQRKSSFLKTVSRETNTNLNVLNDRIEDALPSIEKPDFITARAFASLDKILEISTPIHRKKLKYVLHKGSTCRQEVSDALANYSFHHEMIDSITSADSKILIISDVIVK